MIMVPASKEIHQEPDEPVRVHYMINDKMHQLTNDKIQEHLNKEELIKKKDEEARLLAMTKSELIKVVHEEAKKAKIDPKTILSAKGGEKFKKIQDAEHQVLRIKHYQKIKKAIERNFEVHNPFRFGDFGVTELEELGPIIEKKKNKIVSELMIYLSSSQSSRRKRKHMEMEPEIRVPGLECNRTLFENILFVNNMVTEEFEYGMFFIKVFGDQVFQRMNNMHKVDIETLLTYLVMASNIITPENISICLKLRKMIIEHPDQEKLKSKKVKLESVGYKLD
nr:hypothetical protein [Tanacetum cinerariifolium]